MTAGGYVFRFPSAAAVATVVIVAAAGICGCGPQLSVTQKYTPTVPVSSLIVNDGVGSVWVSSGPGSGMSVTATVHYHTGRPSITHAISGQALTLGSGCTDCSVAFTVTVPATASVTVHMQTGHVTIASVAGDVAVGDDTGAVTVTGLTGDVSVQDGTGSISGTGLSATQASFEDHTGGIDVAFAAAPRRLTAATGTGQVSVRVPSGTTYQVNALPDGDEAGHVGYFDAASPCPPL